MREIVAMVRSHPWGAGRQEKIAELFLNGRQQPNSKLSRELGSRDSCRLIGEFPCLTVVGSRTQRVDQGP